MLNHIRFALLGLILAAHLITTPYANAQVFDSGPSDPNLFDTVINLPTDQVSIGGSVGNNNGDGTPTTQLNVSDGGSVGDFFEALSGSEVNISGGVVGESFEAFSGGEVNINGGIVGGEFKANAGSQVNIDGGSVGTFFNARSGSVVNISGGAIRTYETLPGSETHISGGTVTGLEAFFDSEVNISGGAVGGRFVASPDADVKLIGGEFRLNSSPFAGTTITLNDGDVFTGTLADGSAFIFGEPAGDIVNSVSLTAPPAPLPPTDLTPMVVTSPLASGPSGLREGQVLTMQDGGVLGSNFAVVGATLNVQGGSLGEGAEVAHGTANISSGSVGDSFAAHSGSEVYISGGSVGEFFNAHSGSEVNISGGTFGEFFDAHSGSEVNISGGTFGEFFDARSGSEVNISGGTFEEFFRARANSEVNISGTRFSIDGVPIDNLVLNRALTIHDRDVTLAGLLADGTPFSFYLDSRFIVGTVDYFNTSATLTVTLVPEPGTLALLLAGGTGLLTSHRRRPHTHPTG